MRWIGLAIMAMGCAHGSAYRVDWAYRGIEEGYDHPTRIEVYVDGAKAAESEPQPQSKPGSLSVELTPGAHDVRIVAFAEYNGTWEEHTISNDYSIDCTWQGTVKPGQKTELTFDLDAGTSAR